MPPPSPGSTSNASSRKSTPWLTGARCASKNLRCSVFLSPRAAHLTRFCVALSMLGIPIGECLGAFCAVDARRIVGVGGRDNAKHRLHRGRRVSKPSPSDRSPRPVAALILRDPNGYGRYSRQRPPERRWRLNDAAFGTLAVSGEPICAADAVTSEKAPSIRRLRATSPRAVQVPRRTSRTPSSMGITVICRAHGHRCRSSMGTRTTSAVPDQERVPARQLGTLRSVHRSFTNHAHD